MNIYEKVDYYHKAINEVRPFEGHMLTQLKDYYRIGLTWSSNAIEGNTLTISETKMVLEDGLTVGGHPLRDLYEAVGHGEAYDFMFTLIGKRSITVQDIKAMHRLFYKSIDEGNAGTWRKVNVVVSGSGYAFPVPQEIEKQMRKLEKWVQDKRNNFHPVTFAALLHLKFVTIHPFIDGNGRTGRLIMNLALIQDGFQLAIIPPVLRAEYFDTIRQYQNKGNPAPFYDFIAERVYETQKEIMRLLHIPFTGRP
ncbi:Fic family protein [Desulfotomaculum copahuensis]|uniref:Cell filamentation protein Fic n=1 Tax=Desulfotomaculum copahuensis TaxID=1838280 RepID=A0A1B7LC67_9FIRM|nr:Fic family protein [Desulfotomaculum copahuensis]OAT80338.1 cell filamentation protein Fic [Desulfotomaculum copahuensis]